MERLRLASNNSPSVVRHVRLLIGNSAVVDFFRPLRGALLPTSPGSVAKKALSCAVRGIHVACWLNARINLGSDEPREKGLE